MEKSCCGDKPHCPYWERGDRDNSMVIVALERMAADMLKAAAELAAAAQSLRRNDDRCRR
jgi:hypothetical protein